jgi:hypothetical protein
MISPIGPQHYSKTYDAWRTQTTQECIKSADAEKPSGSTPFQLEEKAQLEMGCEKVTPIDFFVGISKGDGLLHHARGKFSGDNPGH